MLYVCVCCVCCELSTLRTVYCSRTDGRLRGWVMLQSSLRPAPGLQMPGARQGPVCATCRFSAQGLGQVMRLNDTGCARCHTPNQPCSAVLVGYEAAHLKGRVINRFSTAGSVTAQRASHCMQFGCSYPCTSLGSTSVAAQATTNIRYQPQKCRSTRTLVVVLVAASVCIRVFDHVLKRPARPRV